MGSDTVLACDTSAAQCAVAVLSDGRSARRVERVERGHAELLFPLIDETLGDLGLRLDQVSRLVCCVGPGSFVGCRIGVAAARGLALALSCPVVGVSRFEAVAEDARDKGARGAGVAFRGRGGAVQFQRFDAAGTPDAPPRLVPPDEDRTPLLQGLDVLCGDGWPDEASLRRLNREGLPDPLTLARLGRDLPLGSLPAPLYLRPPDAAPPREAPPPLLD